jgi:hypothetical protein
MSYKIFYIDEAGYCFRKEVPEVKIYCAKKGILIKMLPLHGSAPEHPQHLHYFHPDIKVVHLPPNSASLLQPIDEGVICSFKALYTGRTFFQAWNPQKRTDLKPCRNSGRILTLSIYHSVLNSGQGW